MTSSYHTSPDKPVLIDLSIERSDSQTKSSIGRMGWIVGSGLLGLLEEFMEGKH